MLNARTSFLHKILVVTLGAMCTACAIPHEATPVTKTSLPSEPPKVHQLEFKSSQTRTGFPLKPSTETRAALAKPKTEMIEDVETATEKRARKAAEQNPRVRQELGEKFAYFETESFPDMTDVCPTMESDSGQQAPPTATGPITRLTYFSYSLNSTVIVCMQDEELISVGQMKEYQPPESLEEIEKAKKLARADDRLSGKLGNLTGHAILIEPESGWFFDLFSDLGAGNRVLWVTFSKAEERDPLYWAVVDLTNEKVLDAGEEEKQ